MTMVAVDPETHEYPIEVPQQRASITDALISALEAFLGDPDTDVVRETLRASLQRYIDAGQVA